MNSGKLSKPLVSPTTQVPLSQDWMKEELAFTSYGPVFPPGLLSRVRLGPR